MIKRSKNWLYENMQQAAKEVESWSPFMKHAFGVEEDTKEEVDIDFENKNRSTFVD